MLLEEKHAEKYIYVASFLSCQSFTHVSAISAVHLLSTCQGYGFCQIGLVESVQCHGDTSSESGSFYGVYLGSRIESWSCLGVIVHLHSISRPPLYDIFFSCDINVKRAIQDFLCERTVCCSYMSSEFLSPDCGGQCNTRTAKEGHFPPFTQFGLCRFSAFKMWLKLCICASWANINTPTESSPSMYITCRCGALSW